MNSFQIKFMGTFISILILTTPSYAGILDIFRAASKSAETQEVVVPEKKINFDYQDKRKIQRYYRYERLLNQSHKYKKNHGLPPGLAKRKHLPPGLAKKDRLPPGLEKRLDIGESFPDGLDATSLPEELEGILKDLPEKYERIKVEGTIAILNKATNIIVDVIRDLE